MGRKIDGEIFGELAMIAPDLPRISTAICDSCCYMYELDMAVFREKCQDYPNDYLEILKYGKFRFQEERDYYSGEDNDGYGSFSQCSYDPNRNSLFVDSKSTGNLQVHKKLQPKTSRCALREKRDQEKNDVINEIKDSNALAERISFARLSKHDIHETFNLAKGPYGPMLGANKKAE